MIYDPASLRCFQFFFKAGIYIVPLNLPKEERSKKKNWGNICSFSTELMDEDEITSALHCVLNKIVDDFLVLDQGVTCWDKEKGEYFLLRSRLGLVIADLQEMAELLEKVHPTGIFSCQVCEDPSDTWANFLPGGNMVFSSASLFPKQTILQLKTTSRKLEITSQCGMTQNSLRNSNEPLG